MTEDERRQFDRLWEEGEAQVRRVFTAEGHSEVDGMTDWVWERAFGSFPKRLKRAREEEAKTGRPMEWVAWLKTIATNLLIDEVRRAERLTELVGERVSLEGAVDGGRRSGGGMGCGGSAGTDADEALSWQEVVADGGWSGVEEQVEWDELRRVLRKLIWRRPLLDRHTLVLLGERMNDAWVARELKVSESRVRRRRVESFAVLKEELEERGYSRETRPRQPETNRWQIWGLELSGTGKRRK